MLELLPNVIPVEPCTVKLAKVGLELVVISWIKLTRPLLTVKLVLLNWAMPLALVLASSIVIELPLPVVLLILSVPLRPSTDTTPEAPPPPPLVKQVAQLS